VGATASETSCPLPARADGYARRRPEDTLLYALVREHWPRLLERAEEQGGLPRFVVRDFDEYLRCGRLEHGVVRLTCTRCGHELLVGFSCKRRGFCPSCLARRMSDVAAHLVDEVLPEVPIRQWVCSLPWSLRYPLAYNRRLCADVLAAFVGALTRSLRWRAKRQLGLRSIEDALVGAGTFIQRSDSSLRLNVHFHTLALDGVYVRDPRGALVFHALPAPSGEEVAGVAAWTHAALLRVLERHGRSLDGADEPTDALVHEQPGLASCYAASAGDMQLLGAAPGQKTAKLVRPVRPVRLVPSPDEALAEVGGVNIHAKVVVDGRDRKHLERLCRYAARPPLSQDRLELHGDGRVPRLQGRLEGRHPRRLARPARLHRAALRPRPAPSLPHAALPRRARRSLFPARRGRPRSRVSEPARAAPALRSRRRRAARAARAAVAPSVGVAAAPRLRGRCHHLPRRRLRRTHAPRRARHQAPRHRARARHRRAPACA